jgi:hypothetical protein
MSASSSKPLPATERTGGPQATRLRILVGLTVGLAVLGAAIAVLLLARGAPAETGHPVRVGQLVESSFGTFTVTNVKTTFVPDTQGPPTAAQHNGTSGSNQLQVWIRLVNDRAEQGLFYAPTQLRLFTYARSGKGQVPDGSSIKPTLLPRGGSIDGQVWFDLPGGTSTRTGWWLEFKDRIDNTVRVTLDPQQVVPEDPHVH